MSKSMSMLRRREFLWLAAAAAVSPIAFRRVDAAQADVIERIAFGSCAQQSRPQPIWDAIVSGRPQLYMGLGDNIYADTADMTVMETKYALLAAQPGYQKLKASCPIVTTWDDHDYGVNDGGFEYAMRKESQKRFLDFFGEPADSPRRSREGVYHSWTFGPAGKRLQVIMVDTRYHRTPLKAIPKEQRVKGIGPYLPEDSRDADMLGPAQWKWLEEQLKQPADLRLIGSSVQLLAEEHQWEGWRSLPKQRQKMIDLLTSANGCMVFTGDRHHGEISCLSADKAAYPLFDVTSSGLNQMSANHAEKNAHRLGGIHCVHNFGSIAIDWNNEAVTLNVHGVDGAVLSTQRADLNRLRPRNV